MAIQTAKKPVAATPAKPAITPAPVKPAEPVAEAPAEVVEETEGETTEEAEDAAEAKQKRKTRKDFPSGDEGWKAFCEYKKGVALAQVTKWQDRVEVWEKKKTNKTADTAEKNAKKADKLFEAWVQTQRNMGVPEAAIKVGLENFKKEMEKALAAQNKA